MNGIFETILTKTSMDALDKVLIKQVDMCFDSDFGFLSKSGLPSAKKVLDIGTGNAYFLKRLAEKCPETHFTGIDINKELLMSASTDLPANIKLINMSIPEDDNLNGQKYDFIIVRLTLYYAPRRIEIIKWAYESLDIGGRLCVIDVDDGLSFCDPPSNAFKYLFEHIKEVMEPLGADRNIGRKLPRLLAEAGFKDINLEISLCNSNLSLSSSHFYEFWLHQATLSHQLEPLKYSELDLQEFRNYLDSLTSNNAYFVFGGIVLVCGKKCFGSVL